MRRQLVLVRHAKSAWDDHSLADHDRPLAPRGVHALPLLAEHLERAGHRPQIVMVSSARRTVDTFDGIRATVPETATVECDEGLYGASAAEVLARVRGLAVDVDSAMVIGHNPAVQDLALVLVGEGDAARHAQLATKLPTASAVTMSFDASWAELRAGTTRLDDLFMPRPPRS